MWNREGHDHQVRYQIESACNYICRVSLTTYAVNRGVPVILQWTAKEKGLQYDANCPQPDDGHHGEGADPKRFLFAKYPKVEQHDRGLDERHDDPIQGFQGQYCLSSSA